MRRRSGRSTSASSRARRSSNLWAALEFSSCSFTSAWEFSVSRLIKAGRSIALGGSIYIAINFAAGLGYAYLLGWPLKETLIAAGVTTISSSAIVAKVIFDLRRAANPETEMILGINMFEDVFLAFYLSIVSGLVLSGATSIGGVLTSVALSLAFILGLIIVGMKATPLLNRILRIPSNEVFLLVVFACLFLLAGFGETIHVAEAIGALLLGLVLSETEHSERIEHMIVPFRDFFGALFFFGFGLTIDPFGLGGAVWPAAGRGRAYDNRQRRRRSVGGANRQTLHVGFPQHRIDDRLAGRILDYHGESGERRRPGPVLTTFRRSLCINPGCARAAADKGVGAHLRSLGEAVRMAEGTVA